MVARRPPKAKVAGSNPVGSIGLHFLPDSNMFVWKNDKPINQQSQVVLYSYDHLFTSRVTGPYFEQIFGHVT